MFTDFYAVHPYPPHDRIYMPTAPYILYFPIVTQLYVLTPVYYLLDGPWCIKVLPPSLVKSLHVICFYFSVSADVDAQSSEEDAEFAELA